jgi:uncharacterized protein YqjF (DUF2071 family)
MPHRDDTGRRTAARRESARTVRGDHRRAGDDALHSVALADRPVIGYQRWDDIAFLHWDVPAAQLRPFVDARLELDLFEGRAWVSATPFTLLGGRLRWLPPLPLVSRFHELNLRTYVRKDGVPGVWFFSLDAASAPACAAARAALGLPYFRARMGRTLSGSVRRYRSERLPPASRRASFSVRWSAGAPVANAAGTLDHFLAERYALYSTHAGRLLRLRVRHRPWDLREAEVEGLSETLLAAAGIRAPARLAFARCSPGVDVAVLAPELA